MNCSLGKAAAAAALVLSASFSAMAAPGDPVKVIYHINAGNEQATDGLRNANNHLAADPKAKIVFVTHAAGVQFLLDGAKDKNGNPFEATVDTLQAKGVEFRVCNNTLVSRKIDKSKVIPQATIVPSGVAEIGRLQAKEGYVYLKP